jgi:hypothetical protein
VLSSGLHDPREEDFEQEENGRWIHRYGAQSVRALVVVEEGDRPKEDFGRQASAQEEAGKADAVSARRHR